MAKKKRGRRSGKTGAKRRRGGLARISTVDLRNELERRAASVSALQKRRDSLRAELDHLESELAVLTGTPVRSAAPARATGRGRGSKRGGRRREGSLADTLHKVLQGKSLSVVDAVEAVKASGYASKSPNLRVMVNQQLISKKNADRFRRVKRGVYTAK